MIWCFSESQLHEVIEEYFAGNSFCLGCGQKMPCDINCNAGITGPGIQEIKLFLKSDKAKSLRVLNANGTEKDE